MSVTRQFAARRKQKARNQVRDFITASPAEALALGGLAIGFAFGWLARATNYCLMGGVSDWRLTGDVNRLAAAAIAAATAIVGAQAVDGAGFVDLSRSIYLGPRVNWVGALAGGFVFGLGMVYAGGCPSRALVRVGGGDLRSLLTLLIMSVAAYATLSGVFGPARVAIDQATGVSLAPFGVASQSIPALIAATGVDASTSSLVAVLVVAGGLFALAFRGMTVEGRKRRILSGVGVGALVALGWALTGAASDEMSAAPIAPASLSFVKPVADAIDWIERATALGWAGFGATTVFGVALGAFAAALASRELRFQGFADGDDLKRHAFGAVAMGVGGILGFGCTIGQGVTGVSTLSIQSFIAVAAMVAGAVFGVARLERNG
jgi:uncharacterized membrane protein YedE/YeeE